MEEQYKYLEVCQGGRRKGIVGRHNQGNEQQRGMV